jgi:hypothetical protein
VFVKEEIDNILTLLIKEEDNDLEFGDINIFITI